MNRTHLEHAVFALLIMALVWLPAWALGLAGGEWIGAAAGVAFFLGREHAQHEYRLARHRGWHWGPTLPVRWWEGVVRGWSRDSALDCLTPALVCLLLLAAIIHGLPLLM